MTDLQYIDPFLYGYFLDENLEHAERVGLALLHAARNIEIKFSRQLLPETSFETKYNSSGYDKDGYDSNGFDYYGFDKDGFDTGYAWKHCGYEEYIENALDDIETQITEYMMKEKKKYKEVPKTTE